MLDHLNRLLGNQFKFVANYDACLSIVLYVIACLPHRDRTCSAIICCICIDCSMLYWEQRKMKEDEYACIICADGL